MSPSSRRRSSPESEDDFVLISDEDSVPIPSPRPQKRAKRTHSSSPAPDVSFASMLRLSSPSSSFSDDLTGPSSPIKLAHPERNTNFVVDKRGIRDELVVGVIQHLEKTENAPISAKELSLLFMEDIDAVKNSPKPTVLVSSRLTAYLKRPWSALSPCPLSKFTCDSGSRQICYYLSGHPNRPQGALLEAIPGLIDDEDNLPLDMGTSMDDLSAFNLPRMDLDSSRSDSEDDLEFPELSRYSSEPPPFIAAGIPGIDADLLDPDYHGFDLGTLFEHSGSFPSFEATKETPDRMVYALPLLEDIETEFHQAACKSRSRREEERQLASAPAVATSSALSAPTVGIHFVVDGSDWFASSLEDPLSNPFFGESSASSF